MVWLDVLKTLGTSRSQKYYLKQQQNNNNNKPLKIVLLIEIK